MIKRGKAIWWSQLISSTLFMQCFSVWMGQTVEEDVTEMRCDSPVIITGLQKNEALWCTLPLSPKKQKNKKHLIPWIQTLQLCRAKSWCWNIHRRIASVSHPQPDLRYATVGLPLHPRGCLLRAREAQWTEFQWADSFFCLSVRTCRVHVTIWHKQKRWDASFLCSSSSTSSVFHSLSAVCSLCFPRSAFVPLSPSLSVGSFTFSAILSSFTKKSAMHQSDDWSTVVNIVITGSRQA